MRGDQGTTGKTRISVGRCWPMTKKCLTLLSSRATRQIFLPRAWPLPVAAAATSVLLWTICGMATSPIEFTPIPMVTMKSFLLRPQLECPDQPPQRSQRILLSLFHRQTMTDLNESCSFSRAFLPLQLEDPKSSPLLPTPCHKYPSATGRRAE